MPEDTTPSCSFCGKSQHEVQFLIAGPKAHICNECVDLCQDIIGEEELKRERKNLDLGPANG